MLFVIEKRYKDAIYCLILFNFVVKIKINLIINCLVIKNKYKIKYKQIIY